MPRIEVLASDSRRRSAAVATVGINSHLVYAPHLRYARLRLTHPKPACLAALLVCLILAAACPARANPDIVNFRQYSPLLASSGQPTAEQISALPGAGFERVVYLAFTDHDSALPGEDRLVRAAGMGFVQLPVLWDAPQPEDFARFAALMAAEPASRTLVHCQINLRASAFVFLYRVIHQGVPIADAKADMNAIWAPGGVWRAFIFDVLAAHGVAPRCELCDWEAGSAD